MADVEMSDAPVAKKGEGSGSKSVEGKKKFEVKKVQSCQL
jgi:RING-box protein 1